MFIKSLSVVLFLAVTMLQAYDIPDENEVVTRTCRIAVKIQTLPDDDKKGATGRAIVSATLTDDAGNPYRQERVEFSANAGTFTCKNPEDTVASPDGTGNDCFLTGDDGVARLFFVNIPINTQLRVTASYLCDERRISGHATILISHTTVKKRKGVRPRK